MSNDSSREITQLAIAEFLTALNTFTRLMGDEQFREGLLNDLGVPPPASPAGLSQSPSVPNLSGLNAYASSNAPPPDAAAFHDAFEDVLEVTQAYKTWLGTVVNRPGAPVVDQLFSLLLTALTTSHIRNHYPVLWSILKLLGFVEEKVFGHAIPAWELNRAGEFFSDAALYFAKRYNHESDTEEQAWSDGIFVGSTLGLIFFLQKKLKNSGVEIDALYGWDILNEAAVSDVDKLSNRSFTLRVRLSDEAADVNQSTDLYVNFMIISHSHGGPGLFMTFGEGEFEIKTKNSLGEEGWRYNYEIPIPNVSLWMTGSGVQGVGTNGAAFKFKATPPTSLEPWSLLAKGTRIELSPEGLEAAVGVGQSAGKMALKTAIIISTGAADSFIGKMIGAGEFKIDLDLGLAINAKGIGFEGGAGFQLVIPVSKAITIGAASANLQQVMLGVNVGSKGFQFSAGTAISLKLGPLSLLVEQMGFRLLMEGFESDGMTIGFQPPKGIGISIGTAGVSGGGYLFFDPEQEQYAGALMLSIEGFATLKAIGLLTTKLPDDPDGFSLLVIISAEFTPIQLGFGFMLSGIGGLLGINRTSVPEVLRAGVKNKTIDSIMFPKDPVGNASALVAQLNKVFPPASERYTFGLMAQILWGKMLRMNLGLIIEIPQPVRVIILGKISVFAPTEQLAYVEFNLDVVGILDFGAREVSIDASLYDSRVLLYTITGDMALRANWGDHPDFAVSVGGFHPKFVPPANFPKLERAAITLAVGNNPRIRSECYYALTSNSFQMGARAELYAAAGGFSVQGYIGWDLLVQFDPFGFRADFAAGLALKAGDTTLMSISLEGAIGGFSPLWVSGSGSISILFFSVSFNFKFILVEGGAPPSALPVDVLELLVGALADGRNWSAHLPPQFASMFTVRKVFAPADVIVHPLANLAVRQTVVPLGLTLEKFGQSEPKGESLFQINSVKIGGTTAPTTPILDNFAPGQFFDLTDSERLTRPSFEKMQAGVRIGTTQLTQGLVVKKNLTYETKVVQPETELVLMIAMPYQISQEKLNIFAHTGAVARSDARKTGKSKYAAPKIGVAYQETQYAVVSKGDLTAVAGQPSIRSYSMVKQTWKAQHAGTQGMELQIVNVEEAISA